jgi:hypothetical protein
VWTAEGTLHLFVAIDRISKCAPFRGKPFKQNLTQAMIKIDYRNLVYARDRSRCAGRCPGNILLN